MRTSLILATPASLALAGAFASAQDVGPADAAMPSIPPVAAAWAEAWNGDDAAAMAALFAPDGVYEDLAFQVAFQGPEGAAAWVAITADAIPDARVEVLDAFQAGDRIAVRWVFHGTPERFGPIPAPGASFSVPVVSIIDLDGGLIAQVTDFYNLADVFRQAGLDAGDWVPPNPEDARSAGLSSGAD